MLRNRFRLLLYVLSVVILVSGIFARKDSPLALPTSAFMSFCLAVKSGSKYPLTRPMIYVGFLMTVLTLAINVGAVRNATIRDAFAGSVVIGAILLIFMRTHESSE